LPAEVTGKGKARDFGGPLLVIPAVGTILVFFWIGNMAMIHGPADKLTLIALAVVISTTILAAMEIARRPENPETKADSPVLFVVACLLLQPLAYCWHMARRKRYGLRNLVPFAVIEMIIFWWATFYMALAIDEAASDLREKARELERLLGQTTTVHEHRVATAVPSQEAGRTQERVEL
jgi:hypothetical protein